MRFSDEMLMAYADGELDLVARAEIEAAMAKDPAVARAVERHRRLAGKVRVAYDGVLEEPVPAELAALVADPGDARVVELAARGSAPDCSRPLAVAGLDGDRGARCCSACFVGLLLSAGRPAPYGETGRGLVARGELAEEARDRDLPRRRGRSNVHIGVSFRSRDGEFCRSFTYEHEAPLAGLACRHGEDWKIRVLAEAPAIVRRIAHGSVDADGRAAGRGCLDRRRAARRARRKKKRARPAGAERARVSPLGDNARQVFEDRWMNAHFSVPPHACARGSLAFAAARRSGGSGGSTVHRLPHRRQATPASAASTAGVAAANPLAVDAGLEILAAGGSASRCGRRDPGDAGAGGTAELRRRRRRLHALLRCGDEKDHRFRRPRGRAEGASAGMFLDDKGEPLSYGDAVLSGARPACPVRSRCWAPCTRATARCPGRSCSNPRSARLKAASPCRSAWRVS